MLLYINSYWIPYFRPLLIKLIHREGTAPSKTQLSAVRVTISASGGERKMEDSNPQVSPCPGFQDQLPSIQRHLPWGYLTGVEPALTGSTNQCLHRFDFRHQVLGNIRVCVNFYVSLIWWRLGESNPCNDLARIVCYRYTKSPWKLSANYVNFAARLFWLT